MITKDSNVSFYENMPLDVFKGFAVKIGLANGEDLDQVYDSIKDSKQIIEFGSGYGRIVKALQKCSFQGEIVAIERVKELTKVLHKQFQGIQIIEEDLCYLSWQESKVDCILWMWSGILELTPEDQQKVISKAFSLLKDGGKLIIECPFNDSISQVGMLSNDKKIVVKESWGVLDATLVEAQDVAKYSENAGFSTHTLQKYVTSTNLTRAIYTLVK